MHTIVLLFTRVSDTQTDTQTHSGIATEPTNNLSGSSIVQTSTACPQSEVSGEDIWEYHSLQTSMIVEAGSHI